MDRLNIILASKWGYFLALSLVVALLLSPWVASAQSSHPAYLTNVTITGNLICPTPTTGYTTKNIASAQLYNQYTTFIATSSAIDISDPYFASGGSGSPNYCTNAGTALAGAPAGQYVVAWYTSADQQGSRVPPWYYRDFFWDGTSVPVVQSGSAYATSTTQALCDNDLPFGVSLIANGICLSATYLFLPADGSLDQYESFINLLQTQLPFSYFYQSVTLIQDLQASSSVNLPTWSIDFPTTTIGGGTDIGQLFPEEITFLSTTTISKYLPDPQRQALLFLGSSAIWIATVFALYRRIVPEKPLT